MCLLYVYTDSHNVDLTCVHNLVSWTGSVGLLNKGTKPKFAEHTTLVQILILHVVIEL